MTTETADEFAFPSGAGQSKGMTTRDYFAAQAIQGMIGNMISEMALDQGDNPDRLLLAVRNASSLAYLVADAMLEAKEKGPKGQ